jgi:hypothetical protein
VAEGRGSPCVWHVSDLGENPRSTEDRTKMVSRVRQDDVRSMAAIFVRDLSSDALRRVTAVLSSDYDHLSSIWKIDCTFDTWLSSLDHGWFIELTEGIRKL